MYVGLPLHPPIPTPLPLSATFRGPRNRWRPSVKSRLTTGGADRKCKNLTAYGSITTVGDESFYEVDEAEKVWGAKMIRRTEHEA